jgi:hypothetical protein
MTTDSGLPAPTVVDSTTESGHTRCQLCGATGVLQRIGSVLVCCRLSCQDEARSARDNDYARSRRRLTRTASSASMDVWLPTRRAAG